ncbi:MAG: flagellar assembly protein FliH [Gammaproteobacteria bacterium]|jgi:flagellar assembly protein FliH|nr:flagellar assembly protein FliH [Gammaproteobacteria bacterium]
MNISKKKIISADEAGAIQRWQCPVVEQTAGGADGPVTFGPVTAEAIENIQKQAYKEAFDEGLSKGYKEGLAKASAELEQQIQLFKTALAQLSEPFAQLDAEVEQQLTELAIAIARQLVRREIKTDPGQIVAIVREAVLALPSATKKTYVYLHPEDLELVKTKLATSEPESHWRFMEDPILSRGDCKVLTDSSSIDATVERRLASLAANLLGGEREQDSADE